MQDYNLVDNPMQDADNAFQKLARIIVLTSDTALEGTTKNYRTKLASTKADTRESAIKGAYVDGFYSYFNKQASYNEEAISCSELGTLIGMEMLFDIRESLASN